MRLFKFRLEPLLRYREHLAEQVQLKVAKIRSDILGCEDRIARLERSYANTSEELDQKVSSGIDAKQYKQFTHFLAGIESNIESENMQRKELLKHLEEKQKDNSINNDRLVQIIEKSFLTDSGCEEAKKTLLS